MWIRSLRLFFCFVIAAAVSAPSVFMLAQAHAQLPADDEPVPTDVVDEENIAPAANPLELAIREMRAVEQRIVDGDTGAETRRRQEEIVKHLQALIDLANRPRSQDSQSQSNNQQQNSSTKQSPDQQPDEQPQNKKGQDQQDQQQGTKEKNKKDVANSEERHGPRETESAEELVRRRELAKEIWGHLPPAMREQMLNVYGDKYLPKYEEVIRRYFEALAEQGRREQRGR